MSSILDRSREQFRAGCNWLVARCARLPRHTLAWSSIAPGADPAAERQPVRRQRAAQRQGRPHAAAAVHDLRRHPRHPARDRRADQRPALLLQAAGRGGAGLRPLFRARARAAAAVQRHLRRPAGRSPSSIRSRSPMPRTRRWPRACAACASTRRARSATSASSAPTRPTPTPSIPFFTTDREAFLEYDLTKLIYTLANPKKRIVGLMTGLPLDGGMNPMAMMGGGRPTPPQVVMEQIRDFFEVKTLAQDVKEIPADIDVLMVAQPDRLTPEAAYAIDQYVLGGGKMLAFVDPVVETDARQGPMGDGAERAGARVHQAPEVVGGRLRSEQGGRRHRQCPARAVRRRRAPDRDGVRGLARRSIARSIDEKDVLSGGSRAAQPGLGRVPHEGRGRDHAGVADPADEPAGDADRGGEVRHDARSRRPAARLQARGQAADAGRARRRARPTAPSPTARRSPPRRRTTRPRRSAGQGGARQGPAQGRGEADAKPRTRKPRRPRPPSRTRRRAGSTSSSSPTPTC